jgi:thiamine-phosphate pyrophosphorylase
MKSLDPLIQAAQPVVFYVTDFGDRDDQRLSGAGSENIFDKIRNAAIAGVDFIQIREKRLATGDLLNVTREALRVAKEARATTRVIVNDRLDVAIAVGASGVHLGGESLAPAHVIKWYLAGNAAPNFLVGVSCHSADQARAAEKAGANYVFFGPIFDTPSKRRLGHPQGVARLENVCRMVKIPVIAIGGVNESNAVDCVRAGASGIAAIRLFQEAHDAKMLGATLSRVHQIRLP